MPAVVGMNVMTPPPELLVPLSPKSDARVIKLTTSLSIARTTVATGAPPPPNNVPR